jgi:hypothetical protein
MPLVSFIYTLSIHPTAVIRYFSPEGGIIIIQPTSRPQHSFNNYFMPGRLRRKRKVIYTDTRAGKKKLITS